MPPAPPPVSLRQQPAAAYCPVKSGCRVTSEHQAKVHCHVKFVRLVKLNSPVKSNRGMQFDRYPKPETPAPSDTHHVVLLERHDNAALEQNECQVRDKIDEERPSLYHVGGTHYGTPRSSLVACLVLEEEIPGGVHQCKGACRKSRCGSTPTRRESSLQVNARQTRNKIRNSSTTATVANCSPTPDGQRADVRAAP